MTRPHEDLILRLKHGNPSLAGHPFRGYLRVNDGAPSHFSLLSREKQELSGTLRTTLPWTQAASLRDRLLSDTPIYRGPVLNTDGSSFHASLISHVTDSHIIAHDPRNHTATLLISLVALRPKP